MNDVRKVIRNAEIQPTKNEMITDRLKSSEPINAIQ